MFLRRNSRPKIWIAGSKSESSVSQASTTESSELCHFLYYESRIPHTNDSLYQEINEQDLLGIMSESKTRCFKGAYSGLQNTIKLNKGRGHSSPRSPQESQDLDQPAGSSIHGQHSCSHYREPEASSAGALLASYGRESLLIPHEVDRTASTA